MGPYYQLTPEQRLARIAELIGKAALRYWARVRAESAATPEAVPVPMDDESRIMRFLARQGGAASPRELRHALGITRTTLARRLEKLVQARRVIASGQTRSVIYRLCKTEAPSINPP